MIGTSTFFRKSPRRSEARQAHKREVPEHQGLVKKEVQRALSFFVVFFSNQQAQTVYQPSTLPPVKSPRAGGRCREASPGGEEDRLPGAAGSMQLNFREPVVALKYHKHLPLSSVVSKNTSPLFPPSSPPSSLYRLCK